MRCFPPKSFLTFPLHFWQVGVWLTFFNLHMKMNLLVQRNTKWQLVLQLKLWVEFEKYSKCQILGSLTDETSKFYSCSRHHRQESQCMQTPLGIPYKLHMVSFHSAPMRYIPPKKCPDYTLTFLASWGVTQILQLAIGNESHGPAEHIMPVGSAIEALVAHGIVSFCSDKVFSTKNIPDYTLTLVVKKNFSSSNSTCQKTHLASTSMKSSAHLRSQLMLSIVLYISLHGPVQVLWDNEESQATILFSAGIIKLIQSVCLFTRAIILTSIKYSLSLYFCLIFSRTIFGAYWTGTQSSFSLKW